MSSMSPPIAKENNDESGGQATMKTGPDADSSVHLPASQCKEGKSTDSSSESEDKSSPDLDIYLNAADCLPSQVTLIESDSEDDIQLDTGGTVLPTTLIIPNIDIDVFRSPELKMEMEELFRSFSDAVTFNWLSSFKRLRVNFELASVAATARLSLHQHVFHEKTTIICYYATPLTPPNSGNYLKIPPPTKQYLISPPASPPTGWVHRDEKEPVLNQDLIRALANLTPGETREIYPRSGNRPAIVVQTAINEDTKES